MSDCEHYRELISELIDGEVSESEKEKILAHTENCPECKAVYESFIAVSESLKEAEELPHGVHESIMREIRAADKKKKPAWAKILPLAACLVLVIFGSFKLLNVPETNNADEDEAVSVTDKSVEEVSNGACDAAPAALKPYRALDGLLTPVTEDDARSGGTDQLYADAESEPAEEKRAPDYTLTLDSGESVRIYFIEGVAYADFGGGLVQIRGTPEEISRILG